MTARGRLALVACVLAAAPALAQDPADDVAGPPALAASAAAEEVSAAARAATLRMVETARAGDAAGFAGCFDRGALVDRAFELLGRPAKPLERSSASGALLAPHLDELRAVIAERAAFGAEVRLERPYGVGLRSVVLRTRGADAADRYWRVVLDGSDDPRVVDLEPDDTLTWSSEHVATALLFGSTEEDRGALARYRDLLGEAARLAGEGNSSAALNVLARLREAAKSLPAFARAPYWREVMRAGLAADRLEVARAASEELAAGKPRTSLPRFALARIAAAQGRGDRALAHLAVYEGLVGPDAQAAALEGDVRWDAGEQGAALDAWRAALDRNPDCTDALHDLGARLPADELDEWLARFRAARRPELHVEPLLRAWSSDERCAPIRALSALRRETAPQDASGWYYAAACALREGAFERAQELALAGRERARTRGDRDAFDRIWIEAAWSTGDPLEAYRNAPDRAFAFDHIGEQLVFGGGELSQLVALIELRREDAPQDGWLPYYQGQACHAQGDYELAEEHYRVGLTHAVEQGDEPRAAAYRRARADNAFAGGSGAEAYANMPTEDVWNRLLELALAERDGATLAELVRLRRRHAPDDPRLGFWLAHAQVISGQEKAGLERLEARADEWRRDPDLARWVDSDLVRANVRLGRLERALEHAEASTARDGDPFFEFVVQVARGNAEAASNLFRTLRGLGYRAEHVYADRDVGEILREDEAFESFRAVWPPDGPRTR